MKLIVGLGNPGNDYKDTRHNVGYMVLDGYLNSFDWKEKFKSLYIEKKINDEKVLFIKPLTYMNLSGDSVVQFVKYFNISMDDILIIHDDLDLDFGKYRLKFDSSAGGHNGIKSIINRLGTQKFSRLKVGVSNNKNMNTKDYVLGRFSSKEKDELNKTQSVFNNIIDSFISNGIDKTMNIYNTKK